MSNKKLVHRSGYIEVSGQQVSLHGNATHSCPVCELYDVDEKIYTFGEFSIVRCRNCSHQYLDPVLSHESLNLIYNNNYYADKTENHGYFDYTNSRKEILRTYQLRLKKIGKFLQFPSTLKIHEIGSALGFGAKAVSDLYPSFLYSCSDISNDAKEAALSAKIDFFQCTELGIPKNLSESLDIVYMFDVIEHLPKVKPLVKWLSEHVNDGGLVMLTTPDMNDWFNKVLGRRSPSVKIPQHISYFTTQNLCKVFEENFELILNTRDFQYVSYRLISDRVASILDDLELSFIHKLLSPFFRVVAYFPVPNGMKLYLFRKKY
ncbi:MAG: methyltransferase domain-containing protein [Bacteroidota bacterium]